jgi:hypothetical protein
MEKSFAVERQGCNRRRIIRELALHCHDEIFGTDRLLNRGLTMNFTLILEESCYTDIKR